MPGLDFFPEQKKKQEQGFENQRLTVQNKTEGKNK